MWFVSGFATMVCQGLGGSFRAVSEERIPQPAAAGFLGFETSIPCT